MRCESFMHQDIYSIFVYEKYPKNVKFTSIILRDVRSVNAIVIRVEYVKMRKMYIQIEWNDEIITKAIANEFSFFDKTHTDIYNIGLQYNNERL